MLNGLLRSGMGAASKMYENKYSRSVKVTELSFSFQTVFRPQMAQNGSSATPPARILIQTRSHRGAPCMPGSWGPIPRTQRD